MSLLQQALSECIISWIRCNENTYCTKPPPLFNAWNCMPVLSILCHLSFSWARSSHFLLRACLWKKLLMAMYLSGLSGAACTGSWVVILCQKSHLDCIRAVLIPQCFDLCLVRSVSLWWAPLQSADPGRHWAVGGPRGWRRDREQTSVTTLLPHCPAAR